MSARVLLIGAAIAMLLSGAGAGTETAADTSGAEASLPAVPGGPGGPGEVLERIKRPWERMTPEQFAAYQATIDRAVKAEPQEYRWQLAHAILLRASGKAKDARELVKPIAKAHPDDADVQYWLGTLTFETINDAGMLAKMGMADDGKAAYQKAIEIDPSHVEARYALGQFYLRAPGVAGGSMKKAREQGEALLAIERGVMWGHLMLAQAAASDEKWDDMAGSYTKAAEEADSDEARVMVLSMHINSLLREKKDFDAVLPLADAMVEVGSDSAVTGAFFRGEALREKKDYAGAIAAYQRVLDARPEARGSRWGIAACYEAADAPADAARHYAEFAERFPGDSRAGDAKKKAEKLAKKATKPGR